MARSISPAPASAAAQHQSKREKRRTQITDKLSFMHDTFETLQGEHYYAQLMALQCDVNLILRADPYRDGPLEDSTDGIARQLTEAREEVTRNRQPISAEAETSFSNLAGRIYTKFVEDVNGAMESRDTDMTVTYTQYQNELAELNRTHAYRVQLAHQEHRLLSSTLKDRLIQSVATRKAKLLKDKEQLDIADSNALLLNPSQFSIGNPASPGGLQNPRKTRNTRGRPGEGDEPSALSAAEVNKRKRKAAFDDRDEGSPAPAHRAAADSHPAPWSDARAKAIHTQYDAPLYSVDRLFTEKELLMNMNRSHLSTVHYFQQVRQQNIDSRMPGVMAAAASEDANANPPRQVGTEPEPEASDAEEDTGDSTPKQPRSAKQAKQPVHATRSSNRTLAAATGATNPLDSLASVADATSKHQLPQLIASVAAAATRSNNMAPILPGTSAEDEEMDLALIRAGTEDPRHERLVAASRATLGPGESWSDLMRAANLDYGANGASSSSAAELAVAPLGPAAVAMAKSGSSMGALGAVPMSKTMSTGGMSDAGVSMRRTASARGGP